MTKQEFDIWLNSNFEKFQKKFTKQYNITLEEFCEDMSDFYVHVVDGNKLDKIKNYTPYLASFIYYRHYQFFAESREKRQGYLTDNKKITIKLQDINQLEIAEEIILFDEEKWEEEFRELEQKIAKLTLDDKILFNLRFINQMKITQIAKEYGLQKSWISKKIKRVKNKLNDNDNNI